MSTNNMQQWLDNLSSATNTQAERDLAAVRRSGRAIALIPIERRTPLLLRVAVRQDGTAIEMLTEGERTPDLLRLAVQQSAPTIDALTPHERTDEICLIAMQSNPSAFLYLTPEEVASKPQTAAWIQENWAAGEAIIHSVSNSTSITSQWAQRFIAALPRPQVAKQDDTPDGREVTALANGAGTPAATDFDSDPPGDPLIMALVIRFPQSIGSMRREQRTDDVCLTALRMNKSADGHQPRVITLLQPEEFAALPKTAEWIAVNWYLGQNLHGQLAAHLGGEAAATEWGRRFMAAAPAPFEQDAPAPQHRQERGG